MPGPLVDAASATVTAAGAVAFVFPTTVNSNQVFMGSVSVPEAQPNSVNPIVWTAYDTASGLALGPVMASWYGQQSSGPIRITNRLTVIGSGVAPGTIQAQFSGVAYVAPEQAPAWWPSPTPAPPPPGPFTLINTAQTGQLTIPSGSNTLSVLGSISGSVMTGVPVNLGTSLEVERYLLAAGASRLNLYYLPTQNFNLSGPTPVNFTFDLAANTPTWGWTIPNLTPWVYLAVDGPGGANFDIAVITGLPPLSGVTPLSAPSPEVLLNNQTSLAGNGSETFGLPAYTGWATVSATLENLSGSGNHYLGVFINSTDFLGNAMPKIATFTNDYLTDDTGDQFAILMPRTIWLPPLINSVTVFTQTPSATTATISIVAH